MTGARAEGIATFEANEVIEHAIIQDITQNHASRCTGCTAKHRAKDCSADSSKRCSSRTASNAHDKAGFSSGYGCGVSAIGASSCANDSCGFLAIVFLANPVGKATGTVFGHVGVTSVNGREARLVPRFTEVI